MYYFKIVGGSILTQTILFKSNELDKAATIINSGGIVVFPTETVYGLGADVYNREAVKKIFVAKGRPQDNPLIVHVSDIKEIENVTSDFNEKAKKLADAFMPGPITMVLKKKNEIPDIVSAGLDTVGVRLPYSETARSFIKKCACPIAAPSANVSGSVSATNFFDVKDELMGRVDGIIEGEECDFGIESTVIDMTKEVPVILRPGSITYEMIKEILPEVKIHSSLIKGDFEERPSSPGMKYKHYSPKAQVYLVYGDNKKIVEWFLRKEKTDCLFMFNEYITDNENIYDIGSEKNIEQMAKKVFSYLKKADYEGFKTVYIPAVEEKNIGFSVMNRLKKSSGGKIIKI